MFKRNQEETTGMGMAIYFTPHATYVFLCENEYLTISEEGVLEMTDIHNRSIEVTGNIIAIELHSIQEVEGITSLYGLKEVGKPIIQIPVIESLN